jgi:hypothetical protein
MKVKKCQVLCNGTLRGWEILNKDMAIYYECQVADISHLPVIKGYETQNTSRRILPVYGAGKKKSQTKGAPGIKDEDHHARSSEGYKRGCANTPRV